MLIRMAILERIEAGEVSLAFRRWRRPTVRAGGTLRTAVGVLSIDAVMPVDPDAITEADARRAGHRDLAALHDELGEGDGAVYRIALSWAGPDPRVALREDGQLDEADFEALRAAIAALDARTRGPKWALASLHLIGAQDGVTAGEIADRLGFEKAPLKARIRKLKELGLTESLRVGYRLSPRGRAVLDRLRDEA